jgi:hypothetical protein
MFLFGLNKLNEEQLVSVFAYERLPFRIIGDKSLREPVTLKAEVRRFPYTINEAEGLAAHTIRLMPEPGGKIKKVELNERHTIALDGITMTPDGVSMEIGNGRMRAEIKYTHQDNLTPLEPPKGDQEHIIHKPLA